MSAKQSTQHAKLRVSICLKTANFATKRDVDFDYSPTQESLFSRTKFNEKIKFRVKRGTGYTPLPRGVLSLRGKDPAGVRGKKFQSG